MSDVACRSVARWRWVAVLVSRGDAVRVAAGTDVLVTVDVGVRVGVGLGVCGRIRTEVGVAVGGGGELLRRTGTATMSCSLPSLADSWKKTRVPRWGSARRYAMEPLNRPRVPLPEEAVRKSSNKTRP